MNIHFEHIKKLAQIQEVDSRILRLEKELAGHPAETEAVNREFEAVKTELETVKGSSKAAMAGKKDLENQILEAEESIKKHPRDLNAVKSNDAFKALLSEIENLKKSKDEIETKIIETMELLDSLAVGEKTAQAAFKKKEEEKNLRLSEIEKRAGAARSEIAGLKTRRETLFPEIAAEDEVLRKYEHIRKQKGGLALVHIKLDGKSYFCGGCNISLTPDQQVNAHKKDTIVVCENCGRMMYLKETAVGS